MTLDNLVDLSKRYCELLCQRQWANSELLAIAAVTTVLLISMILRRQRREWARALNSRKRRLTAAHKKIQDKAKNAGESSEKNSPELTVVNEQLGNNVVEIAQARRRATKSRHQTRVVQVTDVVGGRTEAREVRGSVQSLKRLLKARSKEIESRDEPRISRGRNATSRAPKGIKVKGPVQMLEELVEDIVDLSTQKGISDGPDARLQAIQQACDELDANNTVATVKALREFINAVQANRDRNGEGLQEDAEDLIEAAQEIIGLIVVK